MQYSFTKDVHNIPILSHITVCLWSYLLIAAQEKIPARYAKGAYVQDFMANIHPESIHSSTTERIQFPHAFTHSLLKTSDFFWSVCSRTAWHLYQWQSSNPFYSQLSPASRWTHPPPRRDLCMSCDLYMSMNCLIFSPLGGLHTGTYHWS
jgi:hypothetical protein